MATIILRPQHLSHVVKHCTSFPRTSVQLKTVIRQRQSAKTASLICPTRSGNIRRESAFSLRESLPVPQRRSAVTATQNDLQINQARSASTPSYPPYEPPKTGLLSKLPPSWVPYAELIRLDKPTGTYYLFFPCLFSTLLAAPLANPIASPSTVLGTSCLFFAGALIMRGAGCTVNDLWDRNLDPHVARTRLRPIARGAVSVRQAIPFLGAQLLAGLGVLLCFPTRCLYYGIPSLLLVGTYPLAKRVTNYPQFVLGLTFSWGAIMGFPALGIDLLSSTPALVSAACLYSSCVAWTVVYDMIYAYQDIRDDAKAGIKSIALAQESNAKTFLSAVAALQVALLAGAGIAAGAGPMFFVGACGSSAVTLGYVIAKVDLGSVSDCWEWFRRGAWITGGAISIGLLGEYAMHYFELYSEAGKEKVVAESLHAE